MPAATIIWSVPLHIVDHPLVQDALMELRDTRTPPPAFRAPQSHQRMLAAEALRDLPRGRQVATPLGAAAGNGRSAAMSSSCRCCARDWACSDAVLELLPHARVGHIGLQRDEGTAIASNYTRGCQRGCRTATC